MKVPIFFSKIVVALLVIALVCAFCSELSTLRAQALLLGDVSGDGDITSVDASMALQIAHGLLSSTSDQRSAADADQDGSITSADAEVILKCAAEKCSAFIWETIGIGGGTLEADDLTLTIPPGAFSEETTIAVKTVDPYPIQYENLDALGSVYQLEHFPPIQEPITVEVSFDPSVISTEDSVYVYQEQTSFITEGVGEAQSGRPRLDTEVDWINGTATIQIAPSATNAAAADPDFIKFSGLQDSDQISEQGAVSVGAFSSSALLDLAEVKDEFFHIKDFSNSSTIDYLNKIMEFLHKAKKELEGLKFSVLVEGQHELPMAVYITDNFQSTNPDAIAEAVRFGNPYDSYIDVKPGEADGQKQIDTGHELFHIVQYLYGAYSTFSWNYQYTWLSEASSVWFETKLTEDKEYSSWQATNNRTFIYSSLEKEDTYHGYGASSFLTYLTDQSEYGEGLVFTIFQKIKNGEDNEIGTGALQAALGGSEKLSELFREFAFTFISKTTTHTNWWEPGPPPGGEVQLYPEIDPQKYTADLTALSAWNVIANPPHGSSDRDYKLVASLAGDNLFIKGAVYARDSSSDPWQLSCEFSPGGTCEVAQFFGEEKKRSANVILVNQQAEYPYNQTIPFTLTLEVIEGDKEDDNPVGHPTESLCPSSIMVNKGVFDEEDIRKYNYHSFELEDYNYESHCRYVEEGESELDARPVSLVLFYSPGLPISSYESGRCGEEGDIIVDVSHYAHSTIRTITAVLFKIGLSTEEEVNTVRQFLSSAVDAKVGVRCLAPDDQL